MRDSTDVGQPSNTTPEKDETYEEKFNFPDEAEATFGNNWNQEAIKLEISGEWEWGKQDLFELARLLCYAAHRIDETKADVKQIFK